MKTAPRFSAHIFDKFIAASPLVYSTINPANAQDRFADVEVKATAIKGSVHMLTVQVEISAYLLGKTVF